MSSEELLLSNPDTEIACFSCLERIGSSTNTAIIKKGAVHDKRPPAGLTNNVTTLFRKEQEHDG
jgi:hypothetical protein